MHVEELGGAAVEAHAFALVELALAVVIGDALALAHPVESVWFEQFQESRGWRQ